MPSRRTLALVAIIAVVAVPVAGYAYERLAESRDARRFPAPGRLVDVGGRRLHILCIGRGGPTILVEPSGLGNSASDAGVRTALAQRTQVCSYDRAGVGWSDRAPRTASIGTLADDLRRLIANAPLDPPLVIVTSSMGGLVTELFARRHPELVAGLVFVDPATSDMFPVVRPALESLKVKAGCAAAIAAGRLGVARAMDPFHLRAVSSDAAARSAALLYGAQPWVAICALVDTLAVSEREFAEAPPLRRDVPLTVLTASTMAGIVPPAFNIDLSSLAPLRAEMHQRLARRSDRSTWRTVESSSHLIAGNHPEAVVAAVLDVVARSDNRR
jgi:pimeloyl-ACP methyl ester carboxylesterase